MSECLFCKIIAKKIPSIPVFEDKDTLAFLELFPSSPGHTLIISKKHGYSIFEYTPSELGKIMASVQKIAQKIETALKTDSLTIGINHHEEKGVPHLHFHIIPRWKTDKGGSIQSIVKNSTKHSRELLAEKIRSVK